MKLTIHTERGTFTSSEQGGASAGEMAHLKDLIQSCASDGEHFTMATETGFLVIGKDILRTAVFVVEQ